VRWEGLDGSQVPLYLQLARGGTLDDWLAAEEMAGRLRVPSLFVKVLDLVEIDDAWLERHRDVDLVLLDEALDERLRRYPAQGRARFSSNWSYVEGIRAEELTRANRRAEAVHRRLAGRAVRLGRLEHARPVGRTDRSDGYVTPRRPRRSRNRARSTTCLRWATTRDHCAALRDGHVELQTTAIGEGERGLRDDLRSDRARGEVFQLDPGSDRRAAKAQACPPTPHRPPPRRAR
jgi:hypothetical protein